MKKLFSALLAVCVLAAAILSLNTTWVFATQAGESAVAGPLSLAGAQAAKLTEDTYALRFGFHLACTGVTADDQHNTVIADDATVVIAGETYPLLGFGAKVSLHNKMPATVPANKLYSVNEDGTVTYTARVVGIDEDNRTTPIYVKGYVTYLDGDTEKTCYTTVHNDNYIDTYIAANFPSAGDALDANLQLGEVTVDLDARTGTMVVKNISRGWETEQNSYLLFSCYNVNGGSLGSIRVNIGRIHAGGQSAPLAFTMPAGTARMEFSLCKAEYWTNGFH